MSTSSVVLRSVRATTSLQTTPRRHSSLLSRGLRSPVPQKELVTIRTGEDGSRTVLPCHELTTHPTSDMFKRTNDALNDLWQAGYTLKETAPCMTTLYTVLPWIISQETHITVTAQVMELLQRLLDNLATKPQLYQDLPIEWVIDGGVLRRRQTMYVLTYKQVRAAVMHYMGVCAPLARLVAEEWHAAHPGKEVPRV